MGRTLSSIRLVPAGRKGAKAIGRAHLVVAGPESPLKRWTFSPLDGPRRAKPVISVLIIDIDGRPTREIEWNLGRLADLPAERRAHFGQIGAGLAERLERL